MTTTGAAPRAPRLDSLTSLRAVAALGVFGIHAAHWLPAALVPLVLPGGAAGVTFFFVLSGTVLAWTHRPGGRTRDFYRRRFARIAPAYWVASVLAVPVLAVRGALSGPDLQRHLPSLVFAQAWFPDPGVHFGGNGVGWSLSVEVVFYALFPLLVVVLRRQPTRTLRATLLALLVAGTAAPVAVWVLVPADLQRWVTTYAPPLRVLEFAAGVCVGLLLARGALPRVPLWAGGLLAAGAYLLAAQAPPSALRTVVLVPLVVLLVAAARSDLAGRRTVLHHRWAVRLGEWSFCFYLVHQLVIRVVQQPALTTTDGRTDLGRNAALFVVALGLAVVAAAALHHLVEVPAERRLRPSRPHGPGPVAAVAPSPLT